MAYRKLAGVDDLYTAWAAIRQPAQAVCGVVAHRKLAGVDDRNTYAWIQAGEYEGTRNIGGRERQNIFREYADRVADGVLERFRTLPSRSTAFTNYSP